MFLTHYQQNYVEKAIMKQYKFKPHARQTGLTLIELTVVMTILVALVGLMVPRVRGFFGAAQDSTSVSSLAEVDKMVQGYYTRFGKEPNNMEALINGALGASATDTNCNATNVPLNSVYCKLMYPGYFGTTTVDTSAVSGNAKEQRATSLTIAGITSVYYNDPNTSDATFSSTILGNPTAINNGFEYTLANVVVPPGNTASIEVYLADVFGTTADQFDGTCYDYVAFGIGNQSTLTRTVMSTAPVHFNADGSSGPNSKYNRFVAIYQVDKLATSVPQGLTNRGCSSGTESAAFIGSVIVGNKAEGRLVGLARTQGQTHKNINKGG
jgi:type II secretory pathway pseudopilin PulG